MTGRFRQVAAGGFLLLSVGVDFTSKILSIAADAMLIGAAVFVLWPVLANKK